MKKMVTLAVSSILLASSAWATGTTKNIKVTEDDTYPWLVYSTIGASDAAFQAIIPSKKGQEITFLGGMNISSKTLPDSAKDRNEQRRLSKITHALIVSDTKKKTSQTVNVICEVETFIQRDASNKQIINATNSIVRSCENNMLGITALPETWRSLRPYTLNEFVSRIKTDFEKMNTCEDAIKIAKRIVGSFSAVMFSEIPKNEILNTVRQMTREGICFGQIYKTFKENGGPWGGDKLMEVMENEWKTSLLDDKFGNLDEKSKVGQRNLEIKKMAQKKASSSNIHHRGEMLVGAK